MATIERSTVISVTIVNDYPIVVAGLASLLAGYDDQIVVRSSSTQLDELATADVILFDTFGKADRRARLDDILSSTDGKVLIFSWAPPISEPDRPGGRGAAGYLSKTASTDELVAAIVAVATGADLLSPVPSVHDEAGSWPGQDDGLTSREAEIVALICTGLSNIEIGRRLFLSPNTVKTYIRSGYRKMGVTSRSQAVLWGLGHGFHAVP